MHISHPTLRRLAPGAVVLAAGLTLTSAALRSPEPQDGRALRAQSLCEKALEDERLDALAVWVRIGGETLYRGAFGSLDGRLADVGSRFPAGAVAEILLAGSVVEAAEERGQSLTEALEPLHPDLPWPLAELSLHGLLAHCTGLAALAPAVHAEPSAWPAEAGAPVDEEAEEGPPAPEPPAWWRHLAEAPRAALPGTCFGWSDANLLLAHAWFEAHTGRDLAGHIEGDLAARLGWDARRVLAPPDVSWTPVRPDLAGPGRALGALPPALAAGRLRLDLAELGGLADALFGGDWLGDVGTRALLADARLDSGERTGQGYGVEHLVLERFQGIGFGGRAGDGLVRVAHYPEIGATAVLLGAGAASSLAGLERELMRVLLDLPLEAPAGLPLAREELERYVGTYQVGCNQLIVLADGQGIALLAGDERLSLEFLGAHSFVGRGGDVRLEFRVTDDGPAREFLLIWSGAQSIARRFGAGERGGTPR